jgi:hypothetical protein
VIVASFVSAIAAVADTLIFDTDPAPRVIGIETLLPPSKFTDPEASPVIEIALGVAKADAVLAFPLKAAVIVPAEKLPLVSRDTIVLEVFALVAVVAVFATLPAVDIVDSFESGKAETTVFSDIAELPSKFTPVAVTSPTNEMALGVASFVAVSAFPTKGPV